MFSVNYMRFRLAALTCACVVMSAACVADASTPSIERVTVDGVNIVNNPAQLGAAPTLTLSETVERDIGGLKKDVADEFDHNNGNLSGLALSDGGFAVIDWFRVRLFDSTGRQTAVVGRAGPGPNEFAGLEQICRMRGDTLVVIDQRRVSVVSPQGEIIRQSTIADLSIPGYGCIDDGTIITQTYAATPADSVMLSHAVRRRDDGSIVDTIGVFPVLTYKGSISQYMSLHTHEQFLYVGDPRQNEVRRYRQDGSLDQIVRMADKPRTMEATDVQQWLSTGAPMAGANTGASGFASRSQEAVWPFYRAIKIDGTGRLWVRNFPLDNSAPDRWTVYDTSGVLIGSLDISRVSARSSASPGGGRRATLPGRPRELVDAFGDFVVLLEHDAEGAPHFITRRVIKANDDGQR